VTLLRSPFAFAAAGALFVAATRSAGAEQLPLKSYTTSDGLVSDRIQCIVSDSRGFLWIGTEDGISRFDGTEFTNLTSADLPGADVRAIVEGHDGTLWAATDRGLAHWDPSFPSVSGVSSAEAVHFPGGSGADDVRSVFEDHDGELWAGTANALYRVNRQGPHSWRISPAHVEGEADGAALRFNALLEDRERRLWAGAETGLYLRIAGTTFRKIGAEAGSPAMVRSLLASRDGGLWVGEYGGLLRLRGEGGSARLLGRVSRETGLAGDHVAALLETSEGEIWAGCYGGLTELADTGASRRVYTSSHGLAGTLVTAVAEDRDGNLWIGTDGAGLFQLVRTGLVRFDASDGMRSTRVGALFLDRDGRPCAFTRGIRPEQIAADDSFVECLDDSRFRTARPRLAAGTLFGWGWSQVVLQDRDGDWWVPTTGGLYRFPSVPLERLERAAPRRVYTERDGLPSRSIFRLFSDRRGDIWIGVLYGGRAVARFDRSTESIKAVGPEPPTPGQPLAFAEDAAGAVWIGFSSGALERHRGDSTDVFGEKDGVPPGRVQALHVDRRGRLWIGTSRGGVARTDRPGDVRPVFRPSGVPLSSANVLTLAEDPQGRVYVGTERGLDRFEAEGGPVRHFTTDDGLAPGVVESAIADHDGNVWFGSVQGLSRLQPAAERPPRPAPARITFIRTHGESRAIAAVGAIQVRLPDLGNDGMPLEIGYAAVDFSPRGQERFQFRLDGVDSDWRTTDQRSIVYGRLAAGDYRFRVRRVAVSSAAGPPAEVAFRVSPPPWRRPEAIAAAALAAAVLLYAWHRARMRAALAIERVRMRVAADLHDDIGAGLSEIAILSELVRQPDSRGESARLLEEIGEGARRLVDSMSDIVWSTDPERDDAASLLQRVRHFAANALESQGIAWRLETDTALEGLALDRDVRRQLFLVVKEALTNVARHARCRRVEVRIHEFAGMLRVEIEDDGRGLPREPSASSAGRGLTSMRARARAMRGELRVGPAKNGVGTRVVLEVPLSRRPWRRPA
jgi:ligand-binding sensor domain-containing protein/signal transduction histidine kinase